MEAITRTNRFWRELTKPVLLLVGATSVVLAAVGLVLPMFPTVPFLLLSLWCFSHASPKLRDWLVNQRHFGPIIDNMINRKGLTRRQLCHCLIGKWVGISAAIFFAPNWHVQLTLAAIAIAVSVYLLRLPRLP